MERMLLTGKRTLTMSYVPVSPKGRRSATEEEKINVATEDFTALIDGLVFETDSINGVLGTLRGMYGTAVPDSFQPPVLAKNYIRLDDDTAAVFLGLVANVLALAKTLQRPDYINFFTHGPGMALNATTSAWLNRNRIPMEAWENFLDGSIFDAQNPIRRVEPRPLNDQRLYVIPETRKPGFFGGLQGDWVTARLERTVANTPGNPFKVGSLRANYEASFAAARTIYDQLHYCRKLEVALICWPQPRQQVDQLTV